ncbi:MAG: hypothetical protein WC583_02790 [Candidatus Omnitrophota bacterium]
MSGWQAVSFITTGTGYAKEAQNLVASASALDVPLHVYEYPPTGTWRGNLNYKSACIRRAFDDYPDQDIVFVDADAIFRKWPVLFDELSASHAFDLSACFFSYTPRSGERDELLSGTLWIQNGDTGRALVKRWHETGIRRPDVRHQMCLKLAIADLGKEGVPVRVNRHPFAYTCIFDYRAARKGQDPVIEHFQASRRLRREVGFGAPLLVHVTDAPAGKAPSSAPLRRQKKISQGQNINILKEHLR